jgi:hypothetical protein
VLISAKIVKLSPNIAQTPLIFGAKRTLAAAPISLIKTVNYRFQPRLYLHLYLLRQSSSKQYL